MPRHLRQRSETASRSRASLDRWSFQRSDVVEEQGGDGLEVVGGGLVDAEQSTDVGDEALVALGASQITIRVGETGKQPHSLPARLVHSPRPRYIGGGPKLL